MNTSAIFANRQPRRGRTALGTFVVVWLNLVLQPCAVALGGTDDHDCPRCPPAHTSEHAGMVMAGQPMAAEMPCATSAEDCSFADDLNYDGRPVQLKVDDTPNELPLAILPDSALVPVAQPVDYTGWHRTRSPPPGATLPLNVLYCVYLK